MRKKTAPPPTPGRRKTSPNQTSGLIAKDQKPKRSAKGKYVLDNRSPSATVGRNQKDVRAVGGRRWPVHAAP